MKKLLLLVLVVGVGIGTTSAQAQVMGENVMAIGAGFDLRFPTGDFGNTAGTGFGGTARFQYGMSRDLTLIGTIGYISFGEKNTFKSSVVPIMFGGKYYATPGSGRVYAMADLGLSIYSVETSILAGLGIGSLSESTTNFSFSVGGGYEMALDPQWLLDAGATFNIIAASGGSANSFGLRVGVNYVLK